MISLPQSLLVCIDRCMGMLMCPYWHKKSLSEYQKLEFEGHLGTISNCTCSNQQVAILVLSEKREPLLQNEGYDFKACRTFLNTCMYAREVGETKTIPPEKPSHWVCVLSAKLDRISTLPQEDSVCMCAVCLFLDYKKGTAWCWRYCKITS